MTAEHEQTAEATAAGMLKVVQRRMVTQYPFHARFIACWQVVASASVKTMGVTVRGESVVLFFNPEFVISCTFPELCGVLHHEVNHLLFEHVFLDPSSFKDQNALVIAEELCANEWITEPLPGRPILLSQYPALPHNEDTVTRYRRLAVEHQGDQNRAGLYRKKHSVVPNSPTHEPEMPALYPNRVNETLDDHSIWGTGGMPSAAIGKMAVRVLVREAAAGVPAEQLLSLPPQLRDRVQSIINGGSAGAAAEVLRDTNGGSLDWRRLLNRYVKQATERRPSFVRPARRFPHLTGVVPGQAHRSTRSQVMVVIDTSASLSPLLLEQMARELGSMAAHHSVTVVECDAEIQAVYQYEGKVRILRGRGGTDLRPPFEPKLIRKVRPDVIVYFTDGFGKAPISPPPLQVVWCLTAEGIQPAPWGRVIRLPAM